MVEGALVRASTLTLLKERGWAFSLGRFPQQLWDLDPIDHQVICLAAKSVLWHLSLLC